jgi:hypothetical protein
MIPQNRNIEPNRYATQKLTFLSMNVEGMEEQLAMFTNLLLLASI